MYRRRQNQTKSIVLQCLTHRILLFAYESVRISDLQVLVQQSFRHIGDFRHSLTRGTRGESKTTTTVWHRKEPNNHVVG